MKRLSMRMMWLTVLLAAVVAEAAQGFARTDALPAAARQSLAREVARARQARPEVFAQVARVVSEADALDEAKRGSLAALGPLLARLGPGALWPMVERLALDTGLGAPARDSARLALSLGLIEAAGAMRDARLGGLWQSILEGPETRLPVLQAAAEALAKLDSDEAALTLLTASRQPGPRGEAVLAAMGHCRRLKVAQALAARLDSRPEAATARRVARSLGDVGSSWAWRTLTGKVRSEEGAVRRVAAEALLRAYLAYDGEVRQAVSNAFLMVDAPEAPSLIATAHQRASEPEQSLLEALAERLRRNPLRSTRGMEGG